MMKKNKGRQKIEMKKMENESNLQVTFSKRRSGLFKKASELCTLCGVEVAIITFSPGKKVFSFGHPCVEDVIDRFLCRSPMKPASSAMHLLEAHRKANVRELNLQLTKVQNEVEQERKRGEELTKMRKARQRDFWWESPIEELNPMQLHQLKSSLEVLKKNIAKQAEKLMIQSTSNHHHRPQIYPGNSSGGRILAHESNNFHEFNGVLMNPPPPPQHNNGYGHGHGFY